MLSDVRHVAAVLRRPHTLLEGPRLSASGEIVYSDVLAGGLWASTPDGEVRELLAKRRGIGGVLRTRRAAGSSAARPCCTCEPTAASVSCSKTRRRAATTISVPARTARCSRASCGFGLSPASSRATAALCGWIARARCGCSASRSCGRTDRHLRRRRDGVRQRLRAKARARDRHERQRHARVLRSSRRVARRPRARLPRRGLGGARRRRRGSRFWPDGTLDEVTPLPARFVSSLSFGGADMRDVVITTADNLEEQELGGTVLRARSEIPGLSVAAVRV